MLQLQVAPAEAGRPVQRQFGDEAIAPENIQPAAKDPIDYIRCCREIAGVGFPNGIYIPGGAQRQVSAAIPTAATQIRGVYEG